MACYRLRLASRFAPSNQLPGINGRLLTMTDTNEKYPKHSPESAPAPQTAEPSGKQLPRPRRLWPSPLGIRLKLSLMTLVLIALITTGSSLVIIDIMDGVLLRSLLKRGTSIGLSTATPAGYSILTNDRLALDNLAAQIEASQNDILYLAILDVKGEILAHSQLEATGSPFELAKGPQIAQGERFTVKQDVHKGRPCYEFQVSILFSAKRVGSVIVGIDAETLLVSKRSARSQIFAISALALAFGMAGTFVLSSFITNPIKRLRTGVSQIKSGDYRVEVAVSSADELGELTRNFNEMSQVIKEQKESLEGSAKELEESYISTVRILAAALDARDNYTLGHSSRVARLSLLIGRKLQLDESALKDLEMACFLHDIGKIHVPDHILNKQTPLDAHESAVIMQHPAQGAKILRLAESLHKYVPAVLHHHEWFNGQGYPDGLQGDEIHPYAQIVAIADCFDAMTSSRPYRKGCSPETAAAEIDKFRGTQFAPHLVDLFLEALGDFQNEHDLSFLQGPL